MTEEEKLRNDASVVTTDGVGPAYGNVMLKCIHVVNAILVAASVAAFFTAGTTAAIITSWVLAWALVTAIALACPSLRSAIPIIGVVVYGGSLLFYIVQSDSCAFSGVGFMTSYVVVAMASVVIVNLWDLMRWARRPTPSQ